MSKMTYNQQSKSNSPLSRLRRAMYLSATLLSFVLAGCGGGSEVPTQAATFSAAGATTSSEAVTTTTTSNPSETTSSTKPTTVPAVGRRVIVFYGDSTMRGAKTYSPSALAPITAPQAMIAALPPDTFTAINEGVNSSHSDELLAGTDGVHRPWATEMANSKADIIIINHGSQFQPAINTYKANLHSLTVQARTAGKFVIFQTPSPTQNGRAGMNPVVTAMKQQAAADNVPVIDVYEYLYGYIGAHGKTVADIIPDGYHPADNVYVLIGKYAASVFGTIVK
jgi:hypothetical protein